MANVQSIRSKLDVLEALCEELKIDVVFLTETWTTEQDKDGDLAISGFSVISRMDKDTLSGIGGGNLVLARDGIRIIGCPNQTLGAGACVQATTAEITDKGGNIRVKLKNVYRSPAKKTEELSIRAVEEICKNAGANTIIMGDVNFPEIDFKTLTSRSYPGTNLSRCSTLLEAMSEGRFEQYVDFPTRIPILDRVESGEFLHLPVHDVICCNSAEMIQNVEAAGSVGKSDHVVVVFELNINAKINSKRLVNDYTKANWTKIEEEMSEWVKPFMT